MTNDKPIGSIFVRIVERLLGTQMGERRQLTGVSLWVVRIIGFAFAAIFIYGAVNGATVFLGPRGTSPVSFDFPFYHIYIDHFILPLYLLFTTILIFLMYPGRKKGANMAKPTAVDWVWCLLSLAVFIEYIYFYEIRGQREGAPAEWNDLVFGMSIAVISLETCRRVLGNVLPVLALFFVFYDWLGPYIPSDLLSHKGLDMPDIMLMIYSEEGVYGIVTRVYANVVFLFILFGAFLQYTRVGDVFVDLAFAIVGKSRGGTAKAAVVSSALVGSVVGAGAANIAVTGTFTIPLMKKSGYEPAYAGGVEATASIGGHLMPPVMGAAVFMMAALTETSYFDILIVSIVPALLYYLSVFASVHFYAGRKKLVVNPLDNTRTIRQILREDGLLLLPIVILIALLLSKFTPFYAAFWSLCSAVVCYSIKKREYLMVTLEIGLALAVLIHADWFLFYLGTVVLIAYTRPESRKFITEIGNIFVNGSVSSLTLGATAGVMGIVLSTISQSGLGLKLPELILSYSFGYLWLALILTAISSYFLGMGMTIMASYILIVILAGPALQDMGIPLLTTHLIVFWLSQDASLTPPFALGAFVAAGIAKADPMRTGFHSVMLAKPLYLVPVMMAYVPAFLMTEGTNWTDTIVTWVSTGVAFVCLTAAIEGFMFIDLTRLDRILLLSITVLLMWYSPIAQPALYSLKAVGVLLLGFTLALQFKRKGAYEQLGY